MTYHKLNHFTSQVVILDFFGNCRRLKEAKKFSTNPGQFKYVTRETAYHVSIAELLIQDLKSQVVELVRRPRTMLKIFYFSRGHQLFHILPA